VRPQQPGSYPALGAAGGNATGGITPPPGPTNQQPAGRNQEVGEAGVLRLFTEPLVTEAGWLLPVALLGIPLVLVVLGRPWPLKAQHLALVLWAGWLLPEVLYFTLNTALFHAYYLIMLGPPLAAVVGATVWALARIWHRRPWLTWTLVAVLTVLTVTFHIITLGLYPAYARTVTAVAVVAGLAGLALLAWRQRRWAVRVAIPLLALSLLVAPLDWSVLTTLNPNANVALPSAGPSAGNAARSWSGPLNPAQERLVDYLLARTDPDSYLLATLRATEAAPYILATGRPVLAVGGFSGTDDVAGVEELTAMVKAGELRYFLGDEWGQKQEIATWLKSSCSVVTLPGLTGPQVRPADQQQGIVLYDCGGEIVEVP
jgi:4-amino-4-deoxy-L-arabinose transferase-like glycosyltransferase